MNEELVVNNLGLVSYTINQMNLKCDYEDFYDAGVEGLIKASSKFGENQKCKFSTFAVACIKNEILKELHVRSYNKRKANYVAFSLNKTNEKIDVPFENLLKSDFDLEQDILKKEKIELLKTIISILEPKDKFMMEHYFELWGNKKMEQKEIAKILNVKQSYVSHRIKRAMRIIKKIMEDKYEKEN